MVLPALAALGWLLASGLELLRYLATDPRYVARFSTRKTPLEGVALPSRGTTERGEFKLEYDGRILRARRAHGAVRRLFVFGWVEAPEGRSPGPATLHWGAGPLAPLVFFGVLVPAFGVGIGQSLVAAVGGLVAGAAFSAAYLGVLRLVTRDAGRRLAVAIEEP